MAKKTRDEVPNPNSVANRDILQRLNFLYQTSQLLGSMGLAQDQQLPTHEPALMGTERKAQRKIQNKMRHPTTMADLSRAHVRSMKVIGQKTNVRMDPAVKRTLCKGCNIVLVPGVTASVRVNTSKSHGHKVLYRCTACKTSRSIPAPPILESTAEDVRPDSTGDPSSSTADPPNDEDSMVISDKEPQPAEGQQQGQKRTRGKKKPLTPRLPPFFERNVGHVIFKGNERLE